MFLYVDDNAGFLFLSSAVIEKILKEVVRLSSSITTTLTLRSVLGEDN